MRAGSPVSRPAGVAIKDLVSTCVFLCFSWRSLPYTRAPGKFRSITPNLRGRERLRSAITGYRRNGPPIGQSVAYERPLVPSVYRTKRNEVDPGTMTFSVRSLAGTRALPETQLGVSNSLVALSSLNPGAGVPHLIRLFLCFGNLAPH